MLEATASVTLVNSSGNQPFVSDIPFCKGTVCVCEGFPDISPLDGGVVKIVEIVQYMDLLPPGDEHLTEMGTNKSRAARYKNSINHEISPRLP